MIPLLSASSSARILVAIDDGNFEYKTELLGNRILVSFPKNDVTTITCLSFLVESDKTEDENSSFSHAFQIQLKDGVVFFF